VLLAGMLFAVGAVALFLSAPPAPPPTGTNLVADASATSSLGIFIQDTPTPAPPATPTPIPSFFFTPTPLLTLPIDTPFLSPTPTFPFVTPTPTATPTRTPRPTPTPTPTPTATPLSCAGVTGETRTTVIGYGNNQSIGPTPRAWCIQQVVFRPFIESDPSNPATGEPGVTRLLENGKKIARDTCSAAECNDTTKSFSPPHLVPAGSTLLYEFTCIDNPDTPESNECMDPDQGGSTIEIDYVVIRGT
jgi:hypothetical protein